MVCKLVVCLIVVFIGEEDGDEGLGKSGEFLSEV